MFALSRRFGVVFLWSAVLPAQQLFHAGTTLRVYANALTRGGAGQGAGELMQRFDADEIAAFGVEDAHPGVNVVRGVAVQMQDFGSSVPNGLVDITLYTEDPARPGYPDLGNALGGATGVASAGSAFLWKLVPLTPPVLAPHGRDLFVGVRVNATTSQFGGTRLNYIRGTVSSSPHDLAGAAMPTSPPEADSHRLFRDVTTNTLTYMSRGQYMIDLLTTSPGGFPTALTNNASYQVSTTPPGTTTMISGLHPDVRSPSHNAGRADDVGFYYQDPGLAVGMPVAFVASFGDFGPVVPMSSYVPGSVGGLCVDASAAFVLGFGTLDGTHAASIVTPIPAAARPYLAGVDRVQQAFGFDTAAGVLRGTQCAKQRL